MPGTVNYRRPRGGRRWSFVRDALPTIAAIGRGYGGMSRAQSVARAHERMLREGAALRERRRKTPFRKRTGGNGAGANRVRQRLLYQTRGSYGGKFRRPRRKWMKLSKYFKQGVSFHVEDGNVFNNANCVYVGHGLPMHQMLRCIVAALLKKLFVKAGFTYGNHLDKVQGDDGTYVVSPGRVRWTYKYNDDGVLLNDSYTIPADATFQAVGDAVFAQMVGYYSTNPSFRPISWQELWFERISVSGGDVTAPASRLLLGKCTVHMSCISKLTIQNRTVATTDVGADEGNRNDVANNPLRGKVYSGFGTGTGLKQSNNTLVLNNTNILCANDRSGIMTMDYDDTNMTTAMANTYERPANANSFTHVSACSSVLLNPGNLKESKLVYNKSIGWNQLFVKLHNWLVGGTGPQGRSRVPIGKFKFYGFEKLCNTQVDEPEISVGYEANHWLRAMVTFKSVGTDTFNVVL